MAPIAGAVAQSVAEGSGRVWEYLRILQFSEVSMSDPLFHRDSPAARPPASLIWRKPRSLLRICRSPAVLRYFEAVYHIQEHPHARGREVRHEVLNSPVDEPMEVFPRAYTVQFQLLNLFREDVVDREAELKKLQQDLRDSALPEGTRRRFRALRTRPEAMREPPLHEGPLTGSTEKSPPERSCREGTSHGARPASLHRR